MNILAREAALRVGVGPRFRGFTLDRIWEAAVLSHILPSRKKTKFLNSHCTGYRYLKDSLTVYSDITCYDSAVDLPNKKLYNQVLRIIKIAVKSDVKTGRI